MNADADELEALAHQMEQELQVPLAVIKAMRKIALNLRRGGKPAPTGGG